MKFFVNFEKVNISKKIFWKEKEKIYDILKVFSVTFRKIYEWNDS